ncbi:spore coat protein [Paenibacillus pinihumi]|uniref:spore coat protein n=1 Tax=Paenibacillus pinihumi TaxID=669462 RepID=UPI0003FAB17D|nr:spore coat protein [Paenibacillus pinihumi]
MYQNHHQALLPDEDLAYTILADLKRVTREYATGATEANCDNVRQMFTNLMNTTLHLQGDLYRIMKQNNMYSAASPCLKQEIDKQIQQNKQNLQKTQQLVQSITGGHQQHPPGFANLVTPDQVHQGNMQHPQNPSYYS